MAIRTITDIKFEEYRVYRQTDEAGTVHVFATLGYRVVTAEGKDFNGSATVELTGTAKTRAAALFQDIKTLAQVQEGL